MRRSHCITLVAGLIPLLLVFSLIAYDRFFTEPARQQVIRRYDDFRRVLAAGESKRVMKCIAPESRAWADGRLHMYQNIATELDDQSIVSISGNEAVITPNPQRHWFLFQGGNTITMIKRNGEWMMGRVSID